MKFLTFIFAGRLLNLAENKMAKFLKIRVQTCQFSADLHKFALQYVNIFMLREHGLLEYTLSFRFLVYSDSLGSFIFSWTTFRT